MTDKTEALFVRVRQWLHKMHQPRDAIVDNGLFVADVEDLLHLAGGDKEPPMSDRFRPVYRELTPAQKALVDAIKDKAAELEKLILAAPQGRGASLALTKLEECVMWATKAIT